MDFIFRAAEAFLKKHKRLQRYRRVFAFLAAVVVFATTYELILPAITMDRRRAAETPGVEVGVAAEGFEDTEEILEAEETAEEQNAEDETVDSTPSGGTASDQTEETDSFDAPDASNASDHTSEESDEDVSDIVETDSAGETASNSDGSLMEGESNEETTENGSGSEASDTVSDAAIESEGIGSGDQAAASAENAAGTGEEILSSEEILTDPVQLTFEAPDRSYLITATFDETAALPADVSLNAVEILPDTQYRDAEDNLLYADYGEYYEKTVDTLEKAGRLADTQVFSARFFDITFTGTDGLPVEPAAPVSIAVKYNTDILSAKDTAETLAVHFDDVKIEDRKDADLPEIGKAEVIETKNRIKKDEIEEISFAAQKFSVYGLAATETLETKVLTANGDTYEISVSYNQKAEIPEGAKLEAYELMAGTDEYEECVAKSANTDENGQTASRFFNISIMADGAEYEPKAPVEVRITLKDTSPEEVAADKDITHFTNAGEVESIPQEVEGSSEGGAEVSFQMDSFSTVEVPLLGAGSTPTYTISVGGTKEITGTESNSANSWSSSDETVATVSNSSTNTATVTGVNAGTATITHTYYVKKKTATEKFTINVEAASGEITETADASDGNVTVSVKRTGSTKKLEGSTLVVEKLTSGADFEEYAQALTDNGGDVSALKGMYHIYLTNSNGDEVSVSNANMEVTITDPELSGISDANVGHFKKNNSGAIESKGFTGEDSTIFKKYSISNSSIKVNIQSFSVITISAGSSSTTSGGTTVTTQNGSILAGVTFDDANEWQIVSEPYTNNNRDSKTEYENVRYQKNVIPTGTENEFYVYLSIDYKQAFADYFATASYAATTSNNNHDTILGSVISQQTGNEGVGVSGTKGQTVHFTDKHGNPVSGVTNNGPAYFTIINTDYEVLAERIPLYWTQAQNVTIYLEIQTSSGVKWIILGTSIKAGNDEYLMLTEEAEALIMSEVAEKAKLNTVTDTMGEYIEFLGMENVSGDLNSEDTNNNYFDSSTNALHWKPVIKTSPEMDIVETSSEITISLPKDLIDWNTGNPIRTVRVKKTVSWALNIAELLYKVRLDVVKDNFNSCASNMESAVGDAYSYKVNESAVLNYDTNKTVAFPVPYVRGLLYDLKLKKVDDDRNSLPGAVFTLKQTSSSVNHPYDSNSSHTDWENWSKTASSGSDGMVTFTGVPWGEYSITETAVPEGYQAPDTNIWNASLCYTTDKSGLQVNVDNTKDMIRKTDDTWEVVNTPLRIAIKKYDSETGIAKTGIPGAAFSLTDGTNTWTEITDSNGLIKWESTSEKKLLPGTYSLTESTAPSGYKKLGSATVTIATDGTVTVSGIGYAMTDGTVSYEAEPSKQYHQIEVANEPINIAVLKVDSNGPITSGVGFRLDGNTEETVDSSGMIYWERVSSGNHTLSESVHPDEYKDISDITVNISDAGVVTENSDSAIVLNEKYAHNGKTYTVIQVTNKKKSINVIIRKTDALGYNNGNPTYLSGAEFTLVQGITTLTGLKESSDDNGYVTQETGIELDSDSEFTLTETKAPAGYTLMDGPITIVTQNGVTASRDMTQYTVVPGTGSDSDTYTIYIPNNPARELPSSGGSGTFIYKIGAMALIALALITSYTLRQRERRYEN